MATITITLSDRQKAFIESQVAAGKFSTVDAFIDDAVETVKQVREDEELAEQMLQEIEQRTGDVTEADRESVWRDIRQRRLNELRAMIAEADQGKFIEYESTEQLLEEVIEGGRQILEERRAAKR